MSEKKPRRDTATAGHVARLRLDNARLRAWLRYLSHRIGLIEWGLSHGEVYDEFVDALSGKPAPKRRKP